LGKPSTVTVKTRKVGEKKEPCPGGPGGGSTPPPLRYPERVGPPGPCKRNKRG